MHFKKINFPIPPQRLLDNCIHNALNGIDIIKWDPGIPDMIDDSVMLNSSVDKAFKQPNIVNAKSTINKTPTELQIWLENNLPFGKNNIKSWILFFKGGDCSVPHIDKFTKTAFNLLLTDPVAITNWYEPKKEFKHLKLPEYGQNSQFLYERLNVIEEIVMPKNVWYSLKTCVIHM